MAYVNETGTRLPNFFATRKTEYYQDKPPTEQVSHLDNGLGGGMTGRRGSGSYGMPSTTTSTTPNQTIHVINRTSESVSYRDGYEVRGNKRPRCKPDQPERERDLQR